jgi:hypothetical protein
MFSQTFFECQTVMQIFYMKEPCEMELEHNDDV